MKTAVIGCGGMGTTHYLSLEALAKERDLEVVALADSRPEFLEKAAAVFPQAHTYADGMELLEKEALDAVHICLPSYLHTKFTVAAMEKGIHVLVEKPVCMTKEEGELLLETEKKTGVKVMVGQVVRFFDEYRYLKNVYDSGELGRLKSIVMQRISSNVKWGFDDWFHDEKRSGSVVVDLHIHDLDFVRYMIGEPESFDVRATAFSSGMVNQVVTTYEFPDTFAVTEGIWDETRGIPFEASFRACFEKGTVLFNSRKTPSVEVCRVDGENEYPEFHREYEKETDAAGINITSLGAYYTEIRYFYDCIEKDEPITVAPLADAVKSVEQAFRELEAARAYISKKGAARA